DGPQVVVIDAVPDHADGMAAIARFAQNAGNVFAYGDRGMRAESGPQSMADAAHGVGIVLGPDNGRPVPQPQAGQHDMPMIGAPVYMHHVEAFLLEELAQTPDLLQERQRA